MKAHCSLLCVFAPLRAVCVRQKKSHAKTQRKAGNQNRENIGFWAVREIQSDSGYCSQNSPVLCGQLHAKAPRF
jgi:hypothetical protein